MKQILALACGGFMLASCAYPQSSIDQGLAQGRLKFIDAPVGATILVDGGVVGQRTAQSMDSFAVTPGTHVVEERLNGAVLLRKPYSVDARATIEVKP